MLHDSGRRFASGAEGADDGCALEETNRAHRHPGSRRRHRRYGRRGHPADPLDGRDAHRIARNTTPPRAVDKNSSAIAGPASTWRRSGPITRSPSIAPAADGKDQWLNLRDAAAYLHVNPKTPRLRSKAAKSKRCIRYRTDRDCSAAPFLTAQQQKRCLIVRANGPGTPQDQIPINQISSLQTYSEMGAMKRSGSTLATATSISCSGVSPAAAISSTSPDSPVVITRGEKRGDVHAVARGELVAILDLVASRRRSPKPETNAAVTANVETSPIVEIGCVGRLVGQRRRRPLQLCRR